MTKLPHLLRSNLTALTQAVCIW